MGKIRHSSYKIRLMLIITYICAGIIPLLLFTVVVFKTTENYFIDERKKELLNQANVYSGHITISGYMSDSSNKRAFDRDIELTSEQSGYRIIVTDDMGAVVNDSNGTEIGKTVLLPEIMEALEKKDVATEQKNGNIYAVTSVVDENGKKIGTVLVAEETTDIEDMVNGIKKPIYVMNVLISFIVLAFVLVMSQTITGPLSKLLEVIRSMSEGHLDTRMPVDECSNNEIMQMAVAVNNMADALEQVETSRQNFVSNVSHELKTPLSSIKVLSESILLNSEAPKEMYIEFLKDINSEVDRMNEMINDLLTLVRLDQKEVPLNFKTESINDVLEDIIKRLRPLADNKEIDLQYNAVKEVEADIDRTKITLAISNLVENAIKYTDNGGNVKVTLDCDHQNTFITVADNGIGMAEDELQNIFQRFYRIDKTRARETGGTGLGLSITRSTVMLHNGSIKVTSHENEGTTFVVRIPLTHVD
ncbi:MAG: HAMP domain-containing histidine kinase [Clostridia bacterium]|nr:HAMP domain-containing histidine kinase [Clostridia bacterium]MCI1999231.1 HAMP domain-containing histidine kinase [Clostridia bacterium]MCI2014816.1 HAMP domain-containing histidine kinase [Clostridia bacterium]